MLYLFHTWWYFFFKLQRWRYYLKVNSFFTVTLLTLFTLLTLLTLFTVYAVNTVHNGHLSDLKMSLNQPGWWCWIIWVVLTSQKKIVWDSGFAGACSCQGEKLVSHSPTVLTMLQGGITCGAIDEPRKSSKVIDERVIINFCDKNVVNARFRDKNGGFIF